MMQQPGKGQSCEAGGCGCGPSPQGIGRRDFLTIAGIGLASGLVADGPTVAGPFEGKDFESLVPRDKKLAPEWVRALTERKASEVYRGQELDWIGMPVGGIACGQVYLGGDGRLWYWDIFTSTSTTDYDGKIWAGPHYEHPLRPRPVFEQGFAIRVGMGDAARVRFLDSRGFSDISFRGEYPIGRVSYRDPAFPVEISLEAFSPFIPLNAEDSSLPATIMAYRVKNPGSEPVQVSLAGWLENAACRKGDGGLNLRRRIRLAEKGDRTLLMADMVPGPEGDVPDRPDMVFGDFEGKDYGKWRVEGVAFGDRPYREDERRFYTALSGYEGQGFVNSHLMRNGEDPAAADEHKGTLTSPEFVIERRFIHFRIGGGSDLEKLGVRLIVDGKPVRSAAGRSAGPMRRESFDVRDLQGKKSHLQVVDFATGGWGHTTFDQVVFSDRPIHRDVRDVPGYGSMALALIGAGAALGTTDLAAETLKSPEGIFQALVGGHKSSVDRDVKRPLVGALGRTVSLAPGESVDFHFVITWHFPSYGQVSGEMGAIAGSERLSRHYASRFPDAAAVADFVADRFGHLSTQTRLWNKTWYDSTLPHWFLDRTFIPITTLATQTFHQFGDGRYWGWEGVDCCPGTCQHVWQYAQSVARIFPSIERDLRERVDFGLAWHDSGAMDFRSENDRHVAHDGFCGTIIRAYREHQMSPGGAFLRRIWPRLKRSVEYIIGQDRDRDGLLEGEQMNTLDAAWFGPMSWVSSLYLAALSAAAAMADELGEAEFAGSCRKLVEAGRQSLVDKLFNGEYFIHRPPDFGHTNTNNGCHADQMLGESMALQVGLPRIFRDKEAHSALQSLWRYNFTPDVGPYREKFKTIPGGRWYAMPGEGGLLVTTFPHGGAEKAGGKNPAFAHYFNECWTGFEYQVAAHMIWEGMVTEGLAIVRMAHDRYQPARRNPYNEVECSDHYSRAMSSHGAFLAACGYDYHGPQGRLGFAPRVTPADFRAPFTAAEGWGTFTQRVDGKLQREQIQVAWGSLRLKVLSFEQVGDGRVVGTRIEAAGREIASKFSQDGRRIRLELSEEIRLIEGQRIDVTLMT